MGDMTPIPAPGRGLSGSANLTVLSKFAPDQPLLPWQRKFENFNRKLAITRLVWEIRPPFMHLGVSGSAKLTEAVRTSKRNRKKATSSSETD